MLYLFDIDGTLLVGAADAHRAALREAVDQVYGVASSEPDTATTAGRTDLEIMRGMAVRAGAAPATTAGGLPDAQRAAAAAYARRVPDDLSACVVDGVHALLEELAGRDGAKLSLVTGNLEPIARLKLHAAGLAGWFPAGQGGFGSDHEQRAALPAVARSRAGDGCRAFAREETVVIGDTPLDIACARADGVRCVAVATGPFGVEALRDADATVPDARGLLGALDGLA